jgi:hypothetical protein
MLYGRRRTDSSLADRQPKRRWILDRSFQLHYTTYLTLTVSGASLLAFGAVFYFLNQNFDIFTSIAFDTHPGLVQHLEREVTWLKLFIVVSFALIMVTTLFLTLRMTQKLIVPLAQMEKHLRKLTQGHWDIPDLHNPNEEFNELLVSYDYFYRSLKMTTETELELLKKLHVDPANREAYAAWKTLLEGKARRLGVSLQKPELKVVNENDAKSDASSSRRHAS